MTDLDGARFADLYAGSGAVGLEALSRGAAHVLLVESDARAARVIRETSRRSGSARPPGWSPARWRRCSPAGPTASPYDVVFADPPYAVPDTEITDAADRAGRHGWLAPDAWWSSSGPRRGAALSWVDGITAERSRRYGETTLWYGRRS